MNATAEHGPDNPRDWDPNHRLLKSTSAPHETAAVLRMYRVGYKPKDIMKMFRLKGTRYMVVAQRALDDETQAYHNGRDVYDGQKT